jgi:predicted transcriptional regulator
MKRRIKNEDYPTDRFGIYDKETGEPIELDYGKITASKPTKQVSVSSKNYLYLDTDRLKILKGNGIPDFEIGLLVLMCSNLAFNNNVAMNDEGVPHTSSSIAEMLGQTSQAVRRKLRKLEEMGVVKKTNIPGHRDMGKVYLVNPYLIRRGKNFSDFLSQIFTDIVPAVKDAGEPLIAEK